MTVPSLLVRDSHLEPVDKVVWMVLYQRLREGRTPVLDEALPAFETVIIEATLAHTGGMKQEAARALGWGRNTLTRKMKELRLLDRDDV